jgi:hypothetical protein
MNKYRVPTSAQPKPPAGAKEASDTFMRKGRAPSSGASKSGMPKASKAPKKNGAKVGIPQTSTKPSV